MGWKRCHRNRWGEAERAHWTIIVAVAVLVLVLEVAEADIESDHRSGADEWGEKTMTCTVQQRPPRACVGKSTGGRKNYSSPLNLWTYILTRL